MRRARSDASWWVAAFLALAVSIAAGCAEKHGPGPRGADRDGSAGSDATLEPEPDATLEPEPDASAPDDAWFQDSLPDRSLPDNPLCAEEYPAQACDGDPHGQWRSVAFCGNTYRNCPGATAESGGYASIEFKEEALHGTLEYVWCVRDGDENVRGGSWVPNITGEVVTHYVITSRAPPVRFCAGATTADSLFDGQRIIWERVRTEGMDCRPSAPCHVGEAHCTADAIVCEDTGINRPLGTACGADAVCDAAGDCIPCAAGGACPVEGDPCHTGVISCATAEPQCIVAGFRDGEPCGEGRFCVTGTCL